MAKAEIVGSWYNTGYHGHFRSKSRSDFINEYRHLSKPPPPKTFINRSGEPIRVHSFSLHDNRNSFTTDALYFEQGLGKKRFKQRKFGFQPDFLTWMPTKGELDKAGPKSSVYKINFMDSTGPVKQQIVKRPKTSFDPGYETSTSYRYAHGLDNPNRDTLNAMSNVGLSTNLTRRHNTSIVTGRESVASCMSWHIPKPPSKPLIPQSTQTMRTKRMTPAATQICVPGESTQQVEMATAPQTTVAPVPMSINPEPCE